MHIQVYHDYDSTPPPKTAKTTLKHLNKPKSLKTKFRPPQKAQLTQPRGVSPICIYAKFLPELEEYADFLAGEKLTVWKTLLWTEIYQK
jgi:hypothetical protein